MIDLKKRYSQEFLAGYKKGHYAGFWDYKWDTEPPHHFKKIQKIYYQKGFEKGYRDGKIEWKECCA